MSTVTKTETKIETKTETKTETIVASQTGVLIFRASCFCFCFCFCEEACACVCLSWSCVFGCLKSQSQCNVT